MWLCVQYQYITFVLPRVEFVQNNVGFNSHMWNRSRYTVKPPLTWNFSGDTENRKILADTEITTKLVGFIRLLRPHSPLLNLSKRSGEGEVGILFWTFGHFLCSSSLWYLKNKYIYKYLYIFLEGIFRPFTNICLSSFKHFWTIWKLSEMKFQCKNW